MVQVRTVIYAIKPKFDNSFFVDLCVLYKVGTWICSASSANTNKNNFTFAFCINTQINLESSSNFVLIEETMDLTCTILLVVMVYFRAKTWFKRHTIWQFSIRFSFFCLKPKIYLHSFWTIFVKTGHTELQR